jgi:fatty-acyl-CoA synthase
MYLATLGEQYPEKSPWGWGFFGRYPGKGDCMRIAHKTIGQAITDVARKFPNNYALIHTDAGIRYNYWLLLWEAERIAKGLIRMGIEQGDRVALWSANIPEWILAQLAVTKAGAVFVPVDPSASPADVRFILEQSESKAIIMARGVEGEEYIDMIQDVRDRLPHLEHIFVTGIRSYPEIILWTELAAMGEDSDSLSLEEREKEIRPEDLVAIMYTSGTTGVPKGVMLDHLGLINKSLASTRRQGLGANDKLCLFFPLFHMFGNTCISLSGLLIGATIVMPCLTFNPSKVLKAIYKEKCTAVYGSPSMIIALLDHPEFKKKHFASVNKGILGGAPCPMELMKKLVQDVGVSNITVAYGITEASSWIAMTHPKDPLDLRVSSIGTPLECNEVKIVSPVTGEALPAGNQGELCVRGLLMKGYYKMPAATASAIDQEGWFHSGDLGEMDKKGYLRITGRLKDVIVRDGIEIHPAEIEEVLYGLPEVSEVQVFGVPDLEKGQEVVAWMKLKKGAKLSLSDASRYARRRLGKPKVPGYFKFVTRFPMTRSGKVQKFRLSEIAKKEYS